MGCKKTNLMKYLCNRAVPSRRPENPSACQTCTSPCEYGRDWLHRLGLEAPPRTGEHMPAYIPGKQTTSLMRLMNRGNCNGR